jgi:hypothetical protein
MNTQTAMTTEEIQTKIAELKAQRGELETTLTKMSKEAALAMVTGENMNTYEENRLKTAEESRHLGELITGLEQALVEAAKNADVELFEKYLAKRGELKPTVQAIRQRVAAAKLELKEAEAEEKRIDEDWLGAHRVIDAYRSRLKTKHGMNDVEISILEAKFKP